MIQYSLVSSLAVQYFREVYRIIGGMLGTLARGLAQNQFRGLPLLLSREEATYLCEKGS